jgi:hypothetical protein
MGLIDLKTDLKSLKYGNDRPGGGSSGQPYIVTPIPNDLSYNGPDFLLRQGALQASLTDSERIFKWFSDPKSVKGLLFTTKQIALERQNPKMVNINRIYLPTNTISQVGLNATGFHLNKQGLDPFELGYAQGGRRGYYYSTINQTLSGNNVENRLTIAYTAKIANQDLGELAINPFGITNLDPNALLSYSGGPDAPLGLGTTRIKLAGDGSGSPRDRTNTYRLTPDLASNFNQVYTFTNAEFSKQTPFIETKSTSLIGLTDYRATINTSLGKKILPETNYRDFNREDTYGTSLTVYNISYPRTSNGNVDPNKLETSYSDILNSTNPTNSDDAFTNDLFNKDLIKFFFEVINPTVVDKDNNNSSTFLFFRAYLNSIGDGFKADWQPYKYVGRAENFYRYSGFSRDVQLSFTIYAHSRAEMKPLYEKLNRLVGTAAPTYSDKGYMLGNFIKLTVGTYFNGVPGIINSISLKPSFEAGWDINRTILGKPIKAEDEDDVGQIPRMIEVDMTFTPVHDFTPQYGEIFINNTPKNPLQPPPSPIGSTDSLDTPGVQLNTTNTRSTLNPVNPTRPGFTRALDAVLNPR